MLSRPSRQPPAEPRIVQRDRPAHRLPRTLAVAGCVIGGGQLEPALPGVRVGLNAGADLGEPSVGGCPLGATGRAAGQVVHGQLPAVGQLLPEALGRPAELPLPPQRPQADRRQQQDGQPQKHRDHTTGLDEVQRP